MFPSDVVVDGRKIILIEEVALGPIGFSFSERLSKLVHGQIK